MSVRRAPLDERVRVLIAGGGVAGLETMLALRSLASEFVQVELLAPEHHFWYRPLSVTEPFDTGRAHRFELAGLAHGAGAIFTPGSLVAVDADAKVARTSSGAEVPFDVLVIACGATPRPWLEGALNFRGPADAEKVRALLAELETRPIRRLTFALPAGLWWPLPLYELALMSAARLAHGRAETDVVVVTPEEQPLSLFGEAASEALRTLLDERGVSLLTGRRVTAFEGAQLTLVPGAPLETERVVTLPRLEGQPIDGVPPGENGFVRVDEFGRVGGLRDVFAAGDITTFPIKQGGLAAQAADAVAETIAAEAGALVIAKPFRPVLRGMLLTGAAPTFMRADLAGSRGPTSIVSQEPLWWPPGKIVGRHLAPVLARALRYGETAPPAEGLPIAIDLSPVQPTAA